MPDEDREQTHDVQKSYVTILEQEIEEALDELERPALGLSLSGLSAGLDIAFSVLLITLIMTLAQGVLPDPVLELLRASAYSVGFVLVIFGRSELFTEHTTLAMLPVLGRAASLAQLGRLWGSSTPPTSSEAPSSPRCSPGSVPPSGRSTRPPSARSPVRSPATRAG